MDPTPNRLTRARALSLMTAPAGGAQEDNKMNTNAGAGTTTPKPGAPTTGQPPRAAQPLGERTNQVSVR